MKIYFSGARIGEKRLLSRVLDYAVENLRSAGAAFAFALFSRRGKNARAQQRKREARTSLPMF